MRVGRTLEGAAPGPSRAGHGSTASLMTPASLQRPSPWTLRGTFALTGIVNTILGPVLPWLSTRWALSDRLAGLLFTFEFAGALLGGVASGWIAARWGTGRTMGVGMTLMVVGTLTTALGPFAVLASGLFIAGLGLGFVIPSMNLLVAKLEPHRRAAALSALNLSWGVGAMTWPIVVYVLHPFVGMTPILLVLGACLAFGARQLWRLPMASAHDGRPVLEPERQGWSIAALLGTLIVVYSGVEMAIGGWVTEYGRRIADLTTAQPGQISAAMFWGGLTIGRAGVAVRLSDRHANHALFAGLLVTACSMPLLLLSRSAALLAVSAMCAGFGMAPVFPVTIVSVARDCAPRVASALIALASLGGATLPWVVGVVSDATGSLTLGLAVLLWLVLALIGGHALRVVLEGREAEESI